MIVGIQPLFKLAGYIMAGSIWKEMTRPVEITIPGYPKPVQGIAGSNVAFESYRVMVGYIMLPFTAETLNGSITLSCPHCGGEWPENCTCGGCPPGECDCWRCSIAPENFEPARDEVAEEKRRRDHSNMRYLTSVLGAPDRQLVVSACDGDTSEAIAALRWLKEHHVSRKMLHSLDVLAKMAGYEAFTCNDILETAVRLGFAPLKDPHGKPPKKRHQITRLLQAAQICAQILYGAV